MMRVGRRARVGVALAPDRLVAILPGGRELETRGTTDLGRVFADLRARAGLARASVAIALVPPLVEVRILALPPLRPEERQRVLTRDTGRYFVGLAGPSVIGAEVVGSHVLAAAAPESLLTEIERAIAAVGWVLEAVVPAQATWAMYAHRRSPDRAGGHVVVRLGHATEVLQLAGGTIVEQRRFRAGDADAERIAGVVAVSAAAGAVTILALPEVDPVTVAARYAARARGPELLSESRRRARRRLVRRIARALSIATAACLVCAAGLDFWALSRALTTLHARRATLAPQVAAVLHARDSLGTTTHGLAALERLEAANPRWSGFVADLADYLPHDAHLVALRAAGDSVVLEGVATQAAGVFQALQQIPQVGGVRAEAPIRQDAAADGSVHEQFAVGTWLRRSSVRPAP
jgi:hypothetical protein